MNNDKGWIKVYRELLDKPIWVNSTAQQKAILITLLLMVNHEERIWNKGGKTYHCKKGEVITSTYKIAQKAGKDITRQQVRTALKYFQKEKFIIIVESKENTKISICNWEKYQGIFYKKTDENLTQFVTHFVTHFATHFATQSKPTIQVKLKGIAPQFVTQPLTQKLTHFVTTNNNKKEDKEDKEEDIRITSNSSSSSNENDRQKALNKKEVLVFFNQEIINAKSTISKIRNITERRKSAINSREREYGTEAIYEVIKKATQSKFLNGHNDRAWIADFDWIMRPNNFIKVLEGKYDNKAVHDPTRGMETAATTADEYTSTI